MASARSTLVDVECSSLRLSLSARYFSQRLLLLDDFNEKITIKKEEEKMNKFPSSIRGAQANFDLHLPKGPYN